MKINVLIIVLLACTAVSTSVTNFRAVAGIDFYQFWAVSKAQELSGYQLKNPYKEMTKYHDVLSEHAARSSDRHLKGANNFRKTLDLCATPLFYSLFTWLPMNYTLAFGLYQFMQIALFIMAVVLLGSLYNGSKTHFLTLALLLLTVYSPLLSELRVANFNTFQIVAIAGLIVLAARTARSDRPLVGSIIVMCAASFITLVKPNLVPVTLLLAVHIWVQHRTRIFAGAVLAAGIFSTILILSASLQFGSWTIWMDWYHFLIGANSTKLFYPVSQGNYAPVLLISEYFKISRTIATVILSCGLFFSALCAIFFNPSRNKAGIKGFVQSAAFAFRDPSLATAVGILIMLVFSPLVWFHYYVLSLMPALWLLSLSERKIWKYVSWIAGGLSLLLTGNILFPLLTLIFGWSLSIPFGITGGLLPLWIGITGYLWSYQASSSEIHST